MSWEEILKEEIDWDKEIKNIFDKLNELAVKYTITPNEPAMQSLTNSLHELEYLYEKNKDEL